MTTFGKCILALLLTLGATAALGQTGVRQPGNSPKATVPSGSSSPVLRNQDAKIMIGVLTRSVDKGVVKDKVVMIDPAALKGAQGAATSAETISKKILRYTRSDIYGIALFQYPWGMPCFWLTAGSWTFTSYPTLGVQDTDTLPGPSPCSGEGNVNYARVYYTWSVHTNDTEQPGMGPVDTFAGEWKAPDWGYDLFYNFVISVDVVRPAGENFEYAGYRSNATDGFYGKWVGVLIPPDTDRDFDFAGDTVRENIKIVTDSCHDRAASLKIDPPINGSWKVGEYLSRSGTKPAPLNHYGYDAVGWNTCVTQAYRCAGVTEPPCIQTVTQTMSHHAHSDPPDVFEKYATNTMSEGIGGHVIESTPSKASIGTVTSRKNGETQPVPAVTSLLFCPQLKLFAAQLPKCFPPDPKP